MKKSRLPAFPAIAARLNPGFCSRPCPAPRWMGQNSSVMRWKMEPLRSFAAYGRGARAYQCALHSLKRSAQGSGALSPRGFLKNSPANIVAVTGTNGKTSVASFVQQIWHADGDQWRVSWDGGYSGGKISTGLCLTQHLTPLSCTKNLPCWPDEGVTHLAIEASSHGLEQRRLEGCEMLVLQPLPISPRTISIITARWTSILSKNCACFLKLLPDWCQCRSRC